MTLNNLIVSQMLKYKTLIFKILLASLVLVYIINQSRSGGDFRVYLGAAELLSESKSCYNVWIPTKGNDACGYSYSPFFATLLIPLTYINEPLPQIFWLILNLFFLYEIWRIIKKYISSFSLSNKQKWLFGFLVILFNIRFVLHNYEMSQMTIFLLFICLKVFDLANEKKNWLSGFLLGLGIIIKILPVVLIPYFLYRNKFKPALISIGFFIVFLFLPALFFGWDFNIKLLTEWWNTINPTRDVFVMQQNLNAEGIHSLSSLMPAFFSSISSMTEVPFNRMLVELNPQKISAILNLTRLALVGFTLFFLRSKPFQDIESRIKSLWELSYILAIIPLIFPHQQKYAFFFFMPATAYILYYLILNWNERFISNVKSRALIFLMTIFFFLTTATTDGLIGDYYNDLSEYYKTITFGVFILIFALSISNPKALKN